MGIPQYLHYTDADFCEEFVMDMERHCSIAGAKDGHFKLGYDAKKYNFRALIVELLQAKGIIEKQFKNLPGLTMLEDLHCYVSKENQVLSDTQQSAAAVALYDMTKKLDDLYVRFIHDIIVPGLGNADVYWQTTPTFRVFFAHSVGYPGEITYHNDVMLGHNPREINVFLPFTSCEASRSLLLAPLSVSLELCQSYQYNFASFANHTQTNKRVQEFCGDICRPIVMGVGEVLIFDGRCLHAGPPNLTDKSRITADFRLLRQTDVKTQDNTYYGTGRRKALFAPGGAFSQKTISQRIAAPTRCLA